MRSAVSTGRPAGLGSVPRPSTDSPPDVPRPVLARARRAVLELRQDPRRTRFETRLHLGDSVRTLTQLPPEPADLGLRTDLLVALAGRLGRGEPLALMDDVPVLAAWLSRPGGLDAHDADVAWALAARQAAPTLDVRVEFFVVTRRGWRHPASEATREWTRLRGSRGRGAGGRSPQSQV